MKEFDYTPILGWSHTRYDIFSTCRRQYYYQYYGKWDAEHPTEHIARLKGLVSVPLLIGAVTHACISTLLRRLLKESARPVDVPRLNDFITRKIEEQHRIADYSQIYYKQTPEIDTAAMQRAIIHGIGNLLGCDRYLWVCERASAAAEPWIIDPEGFGEIRVDGLKAYCKVDFLIPEKGRLHILDWKTGKEPEDKHATQMRGYAAWASYHYEVDLDAVHPTVAYLLPDYHEASVELNEYDMQDFATMVRSQTHEMYELCSDIEENEPFPKDRFPLTRVESHCGYCNFRELCDRA